MISTMMYKHILKSTYVHFILTCTVFFCLGWFLNQYSKKDLNSVRQVRGDAEGYQFVSPLLYIDNSESVFPELDPLKRKVSSYIARAVREDKASDIGFYFRDLGTARWTGVNHDHKFAPASMLKVATLIAYLKLAQKDPNILLEKHEYIPEADSGQVFKPSKYFSAGIKTNRELLSQMIVESDNAAMYILDKGHVDEKIVVYQDLELPNPLEESRDFLSPMQYSRMLRTLYNSSYLSRFYSEEALKLLSYTKFNEGIRAGIGSTTVAHKFGEYTLLDNGRLVDRELHDCGIVYYPGNTYLICIMTKGENFDSLKKVIADISRITFEYVSHLKE